MRFTTGSGGFGAVGFVSALGIAPGFERNLVLQFFGQKDLRCTAVAAIHKMSAFQRNQVLAAAARPFIDAYHPLRLSDRHGFGNAALLSALICSVRHGPARLPNAI